MCLVSDWEARACFYFLLWVFACIFPLDFSDQYLYEAGKPMK